MNDAKKIAIEKHLIHAAIIIEIERIRKKRGLTKTQVANRLNVSKSFLSQLYAGTRFINIEHLAKIQQQLDVNINFSIEARESIRIKNDPKRFAMKYESESSPTTLDPIKSIEFKTVS